LTRPSPRHEDTGLVRPALVAIALLAAPGLRAQPVQTEADEYTRYELVDPGSAQFRVLYEVTATTPGAAFYFNPIRKGSEASDEAVYDRMTGQALPFEVVDGSAARAGGVPDAEADARYIKVRLPRPVPRDGEVRLLIDKTYRDPKSYLVEGDRVVFARSLGIKRNAVVLPRGFELVACNVPAQVLQEADGRIAISFVNLGPDAVAVVVKGRKLP
jgi:hypothetical protein